MTDADRRSRVMLWDLGGVMVDVDLDCARRRWVEATGLAPAEFDAAMFESELWGRMVTGGAGPEGVTAALNAYLAPAGGAALTAASVAEIWNGAIAYSAGMAALARRVARRAVTGVLSDTDPIHGAYIRRTAPFADVVSTWTFSYEVGSLKPGAAMYRAALQSLGADPARVVFVDDKQENVDGALALGLRALRFESEGELEVALRHLGYL